jgi:hypothetical protein
LCINHHNIRSIRNKINDIVHIVQDFDIVFFTVTHLDDYIDSENILLPWFEKPIRKDRNSPRGGVIVYFKNNIRFSRRDDRESANVELMWFEHFTKQSSILVNITYRSKRLCDQHFWTLFDDWLKAAMDENVNIISLGDRSKNCMVNLPACVFDILTVNGLTNLIVIPTHFSGNSETLIDSILVTDSIRAIDSNTIPIDRSISDHDGTYVTIHSGYDQNKSFTRDVWNYMRANYYLMKVNWYELIYNATEINTACTNFTDNFMGICKLCIPSQKNNYT